MLESYKDIADSLHLLSDWTVDDLCKESMYVRDICEEGSGIIKEMMDKLAAYEDAEDQGRLVVLPCKVGETVYVEWSGGREYSKSVVEKISIDTDGQVRFLIPAYLHSHSASWHKTSDFGKTVFFSREEAEAALKGEREDV